MKKYCMFVINTNAQSLSSCGTFNSTVKKHARDLEGKIY